MINYAEETNRILLEQVLTYEHGEVFDLKASPYNMDIMACSSRAATDGQSMVSLVSLPQQPEEVDPEFEYVSTVEVLG